MSPAPAASAPAGQASGGDIGQPASEEDMHRERDNHASR
jgi:hypothetical protein